MSELLKEVKEGVEEIDSALHKKTVASQLGQPLGNRAFQNVGNSLYLQTDLSMSPSPFAWLLAPKGSLGALCTPRGSTTSTIFNYVSADLRLGYVCTRTYCGLNELWIESFDNTTGTFIFQSLKSNLYLAAGSDGNVVLSPNLDNSSKWYPYASGSNYALQNFLYTSLFLRANLDGTTLLAQPSSNATADPLCNFFLDGTRQNLINRPSTNTYIQAYNSVLQLNSSNYYYTNLVFTFIPVDGTNNYAIQTFDGGFINANPDNLTVSIYPYTDPGRLPTSAYWTVQ